MKEIIMEIIDEIEGKVISYRRDFHKYPESGWTEFRTASLIARNLKELGFDVKVGREVISPEDRMGLPSNEVLEKNYLRALAQGADEEFASKMKGGFTGVVGELDNGEGPVIALRFDIDAVDVNETDSLDHFPCIEGFNSVNKNVMHSCGHDGHTAIGLGVANVLARIKNSLKGKVKLIFQPAEEGVRGAKSMVSAGILDDVEFVVSGHLGLKENSSGIIYCGVDGFLATSKFDAYFTGVPAHGGASPEKGKNALLAAAVAVQNLYSIPRHSGGSTRINVGKLIAGTGRNVIPGEAYMAIETRGENSDLNDYMKESALRILESAASMYDVKLEIKSMGGAESACSDDVFVEQIYEVANSITGVRKVIKTKTSLGGSEDFSYMMKKVQENGGKAAYIIFGSDIKASHHHHQFDFNEADMKNAVKLYSLLIYEILKKEN